MVAPEHLEQIKFTDASSYRITMEELDALRADALRLGREPRLVIDFDSHRIRIVIVEEPHPER